MIPSQLVFSYNLREHCRQKSSSERRGFRDEEGLDGLLRTRHMVWGTNGGSPQAAIMHLLFSHYHHRSPTQRIVIQTKTTKDSWKQCNERKLLANCFLKHTKENM